jgi:hypothetical protein
MPKNYTEAKIAIAAADVVIGTFWEGDEEKMLIIKGKRLLQRVVETKTGIKTKLVRLPCDNLEEAEAYRQVVGDAKII